MADKPQKIRIAAQDLRALVSSVFEKCGMERSGADTVADVLVWANLRAVDSHGISRIPRYVEMFASGEAKPKAQMKIARPRPAVITIDADAAPGPVAMKRGMEEAINTARQTGVAWASISGTVHTGAIGYYTSLAADAGMIGIGMLAGIPNMSYAGTKGAAVATSPLAIAVPSAKHGTVILDMATANIALGKIAQYKIQGKSLPEGFALTGEGEPTTDPALAEIPTPLGGAKGAGMSLMFELLTSVLINNPIVSSFHTGTPEGERHRQNGVLIAIDVSAFGGIDTFRSAVDATLETIKALPRAAGWEEILFPGERGQRAFRERSARGIPVPGATWQKLVKDAEKLGVTIPAVQTI